jgi:hypothetical protein
LGNSPIDCYKAMSVRHQLKQIPLSEEECST